MQEEADAPARQGGAQQLRQEHKMVIMNPDGGVWLGQLGNSASKNLVDVTIFRPIFIRVYRVLREIMEERPEGGVLISLVVIGDLLGGEMHGNTPVLGKLLGDLALIGGGEVIRWNAWPAYPHRIF